MRPRLLALAAALSLSLLAPAPGATAAPDPDRGLGGPSLPEQAATTAQERAGEALDRAQAIFADDAAAARQRAAGQELPDATMALNLLMRAYDDLTPSEQRQADALFARPTDPGGDSINGGTFQYDAEEAPACGETICIHYAAPSVDHDHAPPQADTDPENGVPDEVDRALATAEQINTTYEEAGYRRPDGDGARGGETDKVDIYLADTGDSDLYGYCTVDRGSSGRHRPAYCVIDDDFASHEFGFRNTPEENQQVTLAHEYFHAVQFAYDYREDPWVMEATATWAEDELFDDVDDNRQYLVDSQLQQPFVPLDLFGGGSRGFNHYGNWVFFRYLTERWSAETGTMPSLVVDLWRRLSARSGAPDQYSTQGIQSVLAARGTGFTPVYGRFAEAGRRPGTTFEEGARYPVSRPARNWRLSGSRRSIGKGWYADIDHLTSLPLRFRPASGLKQRNWKLRLRVDMPPKASAPVARVARHLKSGKVTTSTIRLRPRGASTKVVGFSARNVRYVELVLVNASRRMRICDAGTSYACSGRSRDDARRTTFSASIFRR